jgi:hypothetical protein
MKRAIGISGFHEEASSGLSRSPELKQTKGKGVVLHKISQNPAAATAGFRVSRGLRRGIPGDPEKQLSAGAPRFANLYLSAPARPEEPSRAAVQGAIRWRPILL